MRNTRPRLRVTLDAVNQKRKKIGKKPLSQRQFEMIFNSMFDFENIDVYTRLCLSPSSL